MGELSVARVLWLLGQDDQLLRPRVSALTVAVTAGALVDVVDSGAARWVGSEAKAHVEVTGVDVADPLVHQWADSLRESTRGAPIAVIHAVNAMGSHVWQEVGEDLARQGLATDVRRPVRRWLAPRRRPDLERAQEVRRHLLKVLAGAEPATAQDRGVLAVASCAGVVEHVLSQTAFTDSGTLEPTRTFLADDALVTRLEPAIFYLTSLGPVLGIS